MKTILLNGNMTQEEYKALLDELRLYANYFSLIVREPNKSLGAMEFLKKLNQSFISSKEVTEWPGTKLIGSKALRVVFKVSIESIEKLKLLSENLMAWVEPELPEDLSFFRSDETPLLISITHENDFLLYLDSDLERKFMINPSVFIKSE